MKFVEGFFCRRIVQVDACHGRCRTFKDDVFHFLNVDVFRFERIEDARQPEPFDEVVEDHGVSILVKADAVLFLLGSVIDYETTRLASRFVFRNPNETDACGCGESVTIEPAKAES